MHDRMHVHAYAKVNLCLSVGPADPSLGGLHPLCGVFACVDLADDLQLTPAERTSVARRWASDAPRPSPIDWASEDDLCVRAVRAYERCVGGSRGTSIRLDKRIPVGGGLGGGSADAAAVLGVLPALHGDDVDHATLVRLAQELGSDVPFFIDPEPMGQAPGDPVLGDLVSGDPVPAIPRPAVVSGTGDSVERLPPIAGDLLLVFPEAACPTAAVYAGFDRSPTSLDEPRVRRLAGRLAAGAFEGLWNDLAHAAGEVAPRVADIREQLASVLGRAVHMTGSGSTLFVAAADEREAQRAQAALRGVPMTRVRLVP
ncbi:MAG: hypothetical protein AAF108_01600 [Planctomycetota bacterium]